MNDQVRTVDLIFKNISIHILCSLPPAAGGAEWAREGIPGLAERADQPAEEAGAAQQARTRRQAGQNGRRPGGQSQTEGAVILIFYIASFTILTVTWILAFTTSRKKNVLTVSCKGNSTGFLIPIV